MYLFIQLLPYTFALSIAALIPGPGMLNVMFKTITDHYQKAYVMLMGLITGDLIYLSVALTGINFVEEFLGQYFSGLLMLAACLYLMYIAWKLWRFEATDTSQPILKHPDLNLRKPSSSTQSKSNLSGVNFFKNYASGLIITLGNPKTIAFYLALLPSIVSRQSSNNDSVILIIVLITITILAIVGSLYILFAFKIKQLFSQPSKLTFVMKILSVFMILVTLALIYIQLS